MTSDAQLVAQAFVAARRSGSAIVSYPGTAPTDMDSAYAIQNIAIRLDGREVAGWKVGKINPPEDARLGTNRLAGPIFADSIVHASLGEEPLMPVFSEGFAAAEAEFLLHVAAGWDGQVPQSNADVLGLLDKVHLGIEVASSPYPGINADGPTVTVSDFGNNYGLVVGPELDGWRETDFNSITVRLDIEGVTAGENTTANMLDGPLGAVRFLLANVKARGLDCSKGAWISTGAVTGVHPVKPGEAVVATFVGQGEVRCRIGQITAG